MSNQEQSWTRQVVESGNKVLDFLFAKYVIYVVVVLDLVIMTALLLDVIVIVQNEELAFSEYIRKDFKLPFMLIGNVGIFWAHGLFVEGEVPGYEHLTRKEHPFQFALSTILGHAFVLIVLSMTSLFAWKNRDARLAELQVFEEDGNNRCNTVEVMQSK